MQCGRVYSCELLGGLQYCEQKSTERSFDSTLNKHLSNDILATTAIYFNINQIYFQPDQ